MTRRKVLITGGAGRIATAFANAFHDRYDLRLFAKPGETVTAPGEVMRGDITDPRTLAPAVVGVDTVLHMAGLANPNTPWAPCLKVNIDGTHNVMQAALDAGCRRVVFASSIHAVDGYPPGELIEASAAPYPPDLYGVSKAAGEALGAYFSTRGLSVICARIGAFHAPGHKFDRYTGRLRTVYFATEDAMRFFARCVDAENVTYAVVNAVSANANPRLALEETRLAIGYEAAEGLQ